MEEQLQRALKKLEVSEAKRNKLLQALESLKEKTLALLSVADRNKELQNALEESRRQLAEAVAAQQQAETRAAQAVSAQRKAEAALKSAQKQLSQLSKQQGSSMPQPPIPPPPKAGGSRARQKAAATSSAASSDSLLRGEVDILRTQLRQMQESQKRSEAREQQLASRLTAHGAQLQQLQQLRQQAAILSGGAQPTAAAAAAGAPPAWPGAALLHPHQMQQVVDAVLARVAPLVAQQQLGQPQSHQQQAAQHQQVATQHQQQLAWNSGAAAAGGGSRAASVEPECCSGAPKHWALGRPQQVPPGQPPLGAGASVGHVSSAAATTHALQPVRTPSWHGHPPANLGGCSTSSVMHSGSTDPGSPELPVLSDAWVDQHGCDRRVQRRSQQQTQQQRLQRGQEGQQQRRSVTPDLGHASLFSSGSSSGGEMDEGEDGDICSSAAGMPVAGLGSKRPAGVQLRGRGERAPKRPQQSQHPQPLEQLQQQIKQEQQQVQQQRGQQQRGSTTALLHAGEHLSKLRRVPTPHQVGASAAGGQREEDEEEAVAAALAAEVAAGMPVSTLAQAFRWSALSQARRAWDASLLAQPSLCSPEQLGLLGWAQDAAAEATALRRLARCARLLLQRLPKDAAGELEGALLAQLRAASGLQAAPVAAAATGAMAARATGAAGAAGAALAAAAQGTVEERLPMACAAAAALMFVLRELGGVGAARSVVGELLAAHSQRQQQLAERGSGGSSGLGSVPVLPMLLSAVAAWPEALVEEQQVHVGRGTHGSQALVARGGNPQLAAPLAGLRAACALEAGGAAGGELGAEGADEGDEDDDIWDMAADMSCLLAQAEQQKEAPQQQHPQQQQQQDQERGHNEQQLGHTQSTQRQYGPEDAAAAAALRAAAPLWWGAYWQQG